MNATAENISLFDVGQRRCTRCGDVKALGEYRERRDTLMAAIRYIKERG